MLHILFCLCAVCSNPVSCFSGREAGGGRAGSCRNQSHMAAAYGKCGFFLFQSRTLKGTAFLFYFVRYFRKKRWKRKKGEA